MLDFMFLTRDMKNCVIYMLADLVLTVSAVTGVLLLAERFGGIGNWGKPEVLFMLGFAALSIVMMEALLGYNILWISRRIGRGQMDHVLIQPRPVWMALLTEGFLPFAMGPALIPGIALLAWGVSGLEIPLTFSWWGWFTLNLLASGAVIAAFSFIWGSLAFWAPAGAEEISSSAITLMSELKSFPLDGLGRGLKAGLLSFLPVGFVAWYPAGALLGHRDWPYSLVMTPLASVILCGIAAALFNRGMRYYAYNGSSRYLDLGHRR